jgi:hypothetical protein
MSNSARGFFQLSNYARSVAAQDALDLRLQAR